MKFSNFKKFKLAFLALLLGFTTILGTACGNNREDDKKQKVEETQKKQEEAKKEEEKKKTEIKQDSTKQDSGNDISEEDTKKRIKQSVEILNKNYEGKMTISFIEEKNDLVFEYIGDFKNNMSLFMDNTDNKDAKKYWDLMVHSQVEYSQAIKSINPGMSIVILNPKDKNKELLRIKDGVIEYNYFK